MRKGKKSPDSMTFLEHLDDLRKRIIYSLVALFIVVIPAFVFSKDIFRILAQPVTKYLPRGIKMAYTTLPSPFMVYIKVSFLGAVFFTSPFIFYQIWKFVAPGLYQKEKKYVIPFVFMTTFFFILGAFFGYFVIFPFACRFFLDVGSEFQPVITIDKYLSLGLHLLLGIALIFELPTLVFFLARMGLITAGWMARNFKYAVLAVFIIAAVITPTPDWFNQTILALPMLALYALSILIALFAGKKRKKQKESSSDLVG
jgi:sec-independent protein translocase protein TatC